MLRCTGPRFFILLCILLQSRPSIFAAASKVKRSILGLDVAGPILPAPLGPTPFAPFGVGSPFASPTHPPTFPAPFSAPFPLPLPVFPPPQLYAASYYPPSFYPSPPLPHPPPLPAGSAALPPAPIIVPAKTAAALSVASIIHALIARKFYPPVLPFPVASPVPFPVPVKVPATIAVERPALVPAKRPLFLSSPHAASPPFEVHEVVREELPAAQEESEVLAAFPARPPSEETWKAQFIPLHDKLIE